VSYVSSSLESGRIPYRLCSETEYYDMATIKTIAYQPKSIPTLELGSVSTLPNSTLESDPNMKTDISPDGTLAAVVNSYACILYKYNTILATYSNSTSHNTCVLIFENTLYWLRCCLSL